MEKVTILGAGLVGSLLSIYLRKQGYNVDVYERRSDLRVSQSDKGRSINLALSDRGFKALRGASEVLAEEIKSKAIPMKGRMVHGEDGKQSLQPYGKEDQYIYSISRSQLNEILINFAEKEGNGTFNFNERCLDINLNDGTITFENTISSESHKVNGEIVIGADGAYSSLRSSLQKTDLFNYSQKYLEYGYKELSIPPNKSGEHQLFKNALHIWPRKSFMLIALPNQDGSFTCTLFLPFQGATSFESLRSPSDVKTFFSVHFNDAIEMMPNLLEEFSANPTSSLVTIKCYPWSHKGKYSLIGDAAHAIVPFYGQGMNAGFEDCTVLNEIIKSEKKDWESIFQNFQRLRKEDADAIAELAFRNFIEMRDLVIDEKFLLRKKIESKLSELYPKEWIPLYTMVTFSDMKYSKALKLGKLQDEIMEEVLDISGIETSWENLDFEAVLKKYKTAQNRLNILQS